MSYNIGLQVLRAKVRGFHAAGSTISFRISKSEKEQKHRLWESKRKLGSHARHHMIAYGLLRGIAYHQIERCALNNKPDLKYLLRIVQDHGGKSWTLESLMQLLERSSTASLPQTEDSQQIQSLAQTPPSISERAVLVTQKPLEKSA